MADPRGESRVRLKHAVRRHRALSREGLLERLFERLVGRLFARAVERYTSAFEARADLVYGRTEPALASQQ